jgi:hypothetical protein
MVSWEQHGVVEALLLLLRLVLMLRCLRMLV